MSWQGIEGHDRVVEMFARAFSRGRLEGSFLFTGPEGIGKRSFAFQLAKTVLCMHPQGFAPCGQCESCRLFDLRYVPQKEEVVQSEKLAAARSRKSKKIESKQPEKEPPKGPEPFFVPNHPDFYYISKPADRTQLPLDLLIGSKEERGQNGLCAHLSRTPFFGTRKVAVIDDADTLNEEGANALLKTLEEPPKGSLLILIGTSAAKQLPTIRSRCQLVRFAPLSNRDLAKILLNTGSADNLEEGLRLAKFAGGSCSAALEYKDESFERFRVELFKELAKPYPDYIQFSKKMIEFVDAKGKDGQIRRRRLTVILNRAAAFYRDLTRLLSGDQSVLIGNHLSGSELRTAAQNRPDPLLAAAKTQRTIEAIGQIDRMANLPYIIESWLIDLRSGMPKFKIED